MKRQRKLFGRVGLDAASVWPDGGTVENPTERDLLALTRRGVADPEWRRALTRASVDTLSLALLDPTLTDKVRSHIDGRLQSTKHRPQLWHLYRNRLHHPSQPISQANRVTPEDQ
jgi:hypothetical protein